MDEHQQARLIELLRAEEEAVFAQGIELLRSGGILPHDRFTLARMLQRRPARAFAVMLDHDADRDESLRRYGLRCLEALGALEEAKRRQPLPESFTALLNEALDGTGSDTSRARCAEAVDALRAHHRAREFATADPDRFIALRLSEALLAMLSGAPVVPILAETIRALSQLEPRGLLSSEIQHRADRCDEIRDKMLSGILNAQLRPCVTPS